jgi:hypothetical protein
MTWWATRLTTDRVLVVQTAEGLHRSRRGLRTWKVFPCERRSLGKSKRAGRYGTTYLRRFANPAIVCAAVS